MTTIDYPARRLNTQFIFLTALSLVLMSWLGTTELGLSGPLSLVLAVQIMLFFALFNRPIWAMASLMVGQFTASGYMFSLTPDLDISIRFLWTILAVLLLVPIVKNRTGIKLGNGARRILIPAIIFFVLATIANAVNTDLTITLKYSRQSATALAILVLLPAVVENRRDIKLLSIVALVTCAISAAAAVMQHYSFLGTPVITLYDSNYSGARTPGLSESALHLAYYLPIILMPMVAIFFIKGVGSHTRMLLAFLAIVMVTALYFTFTRSGMYSLIPGALIMIFLMKGKAKKELLLVALILLGAFVYYADTQDNRYSQWFTDDSSAAARPVLWQAGISIAMDNPILGIGYYTFEETSLDYSSRINPVYLETQGAGGILGETEPHNDFVRVWLSFGTLALLAYLWLFVGIFRNFLVSYRQSKDRLLKGLALGCIGALITYIVNASLHNVMDSMWVLWILGGFSIAIVKLATITKPSTVVREP